MLIISDIDGTICNMVGAIIDDINTKFGTRFTSDDWESYVPYKIMDALAARGKHIGQIWLRSNYYHNSTFLANCKPYHSDIKAYFKAIAENGPLQAPGSGSANSDIDACTLLTFITCRPITTHVATMHWLKEHYAKGMYQPPVIFAKSNEHKARVVEKLCAFYEHESVLYLEDNQNIKPDTPANLIVYRPRRPWNKHEQYAIGDLI